MDQGEEILRTPCQQEVHWDWVTTAWAPLRSQVLGIDTATCASNQLLLAMFSALRNPQAAGRDGHMIQDSCWCKGGLGAGQGDHSAWGWEGLSEQDPQG